MFGLIRRALAEVAHSPARRKESLIEEAGSHADDEITSTKARGRGYQRQKRDPYCADVLRQEE